MDKEKEENKKPLGLEEAREQLAEAWLDFWSGSRTPHDSEIRNGRVLEVLERLSPTDRDYFLHAEEGKDSQLAQIREMSKRLASTRHTPSKGERLHTRRQKARQRRGTDPRKIH